MASSLSSHHVLHPQGLHAIRHRRLRTDVPYSSLGADCARRLHDGRLASLVECCTNQAREAGCNVSLSRPAQTVEAGVCGAPNLEPSLTSLVVAFLTRAAWPPFHMPCDLVSPRLIENCTSCEMPIYSSASDHDAVSGTHKRKNACKFESVPPSSKKRLKSVHSRPSLYDYIPKHHLSSRILRELDRRNPTEYLYIKKSVRSLPVDRRRLKSFAMHGGPDLEDIRGVREGSCYHIRVPH